VVRRPEGFLWKRHNPKLPVCPFALFFAHFSTTGCRILHYFDFDLEVMKSEVGN
jgi:hypothetical protein